MATTENVKEYRGVENLYVARVTQDNAENYTTDTPQYLAGLATVAKSVESSSAKKYYDNQAKIQISSIGTPELTLTTSAIDNSKLAYITGQNYDDTLDVLYHGGDFKPVDVALMFDYSDTEGNKNYVVFYKGRFSIPDGTYNTATDDASAGNGCELTYSSVQTTHKFAQAGNLSLAGAEYFVEGGDLANAKVDLTDFFDSVITPDTATALSSVDTEASEEPVE